MAAGRIATNLNWRIAMKKLGEHAVVIGAGIGGLLAARVLSDFYTRVTVLERDAFPAADTPRKGVPQGI
jgi:2-polyprenyl-6-methoxyphenol hydroxylase-like FAD-dependent oxidoreductase